MNRLLVSAIFVIFAIQPIQNFMKRIIITAIAILMGFASYAQGHMKFKGHDIDGTPAELAQKLVADGFKITQ